MACHHPPEELQRVYDGRPKPLPGRFFCGLCGEPVYALPGPTREQFAAARQRNSETFGRRHLLARSLQE
jgi:hypothetical protein